LLIGIQFVILSDGRLQVVNFQLENKIYLLRLAWDFAYNYSLGFL